MADNKIMPVVFCGHGNPMNAIGDSRARRGWKEEGMRLGKPFVIIAVSAHWTTKGLFVRRSDVNPQKNDMYGFPKELYDVHYEPKGSVEYADRVLDRLGGQAEATNDWGIDHGVWSVLSNMYPDADVPVVMLSTDVTADAKTQFETGRKLKRLREDGAMIVASGNVVHNLRMVNWDMNGGYDWADRFDEVIKKAILEGDFDVPVVFKKIDDYALSIPTVEHYYPLLVALGAVDKDDKIDVWNEYRELGSMSMTSYTFTK